MTRVSKILGRGKSLFVGLESFFLSFSSSHSFNLHCSFPSLSTPITIMLRRITPTGASLARHLIATTSSKRTITSSTRALNKAQDNFTKVLREEIDSIKAAGTYKSERIIISPQNSSIRVAGKDGKTSDQINFCANNYLGKTSWTRNKG